MLGYSEDVLILGQSRHSWRSYEDAEVIKFFCVLKLCMVGGSSCTLCSSESLTCTTLRPRPSLSFAAICTRLSAFAFSRGLRAKKAVYLPHRRSIGQAPEPYNRYCLVSHRRGRETRRLRYPWLDIAKTLGRPDPTLGWPVVGLASGLQTPTHHQDRAPPRGGGRLWPDPTAISRKVIANSNLRNLVGMCWRIPALPAWRLPRCLLFVFSVEDMLWKF
jgi:hypothetical protein